MGERRSFGMEGSNWRLPPVLIGLFILCLFYEIHVAFQLPQLYGWLRLIFYAELLIVVLEFGRAARQEPLLWLLPLAIVGWRLPFLLQANGLLFTSDNALEALQCLQIQETHQAPFFLLNAINHNGPFVHTLVAFLWDITGSSYLTFVLMQLFIFGAFHVVLYYWLKRHLSSGSLWLILVLNFIFLPVIFDYSLYLRAGPYFHVLFFLILGLALFEPELPSLSNLFLSLYFVFFALYINPAGLFLAFAFLVVIVMQAARHKKWLLALGSLSLAVVTAGFPWLLAWRKSLIPHVDYGKWYSLEFLPFKDIFSWRFYAYLLKAVEQSYRVFVNLFRFELNYLMKFYSQFEEKVPLFSALNTGLILISLGVFVSACYFFARIILTDVRQHCFSPLGWLAWFFFLLVLAEIGKNLFLLPSHLIEPRHHLDLAFLLMISYGFFLDRILSIKKFFSFKSLGVILLLCLLSLPHLFYYYQHTCFKQHSYQQIIGFLEKHRIRFVTTDFIIAYPIYFLTKKKVLVSNSLGPLTVRFFFPDMDRQVDALPADEKVYLFFSKDYYREDWHRHLTAMKRKEVIESLRSAGIPFRIINLKKYFLIVPLKLLRKQLAF